MDQKEIERQALAEARAEMRGARKPDAEGDQSQGSGPFIVIAVLGLGLAAIVGFMLADPCASMRALWWVNGAGMRSCAFEARCALNDGSMPHVPPGAPYIYFDESAPVICRGVQF